MSRSNLVALLVIDVQQGLDDPSWGTRNNPDAESNMASLIEFWRATGRPIIHVQHASVEPASPLRPDGPGFAFKTFAEPTGGEAQFTKSVNSAFIGTGLEAHVRNEGIGSLVIIGLTTDHCVSTSTRMAANLGFDVTLVSDATATFDRVGPDGTRHSAETMHAVNLASLHGEFCRVRSTRDVLAGLGSAS